MTVPLLVITRKMLDTSHYILTLKSLYIINCNLCSKIRILTEILKIASTHRRTIDIHTRTKENMHTPCPGILSESDTHLFNQFSVPCRCRSNTTWIKSTAGIVPDTLGAIYHFDSRKSETFYRPYIPALVSTDIRDLLVKSHLRNYIRCPVLMFLSDT
jgi:hypothetical protein